MDVSPGTKIGDGYSIVDEIAHGRLGTVYRASQSSLGHLVAIRVLPPACTTHEGFHERFQRDAKAIASLRHRNIVPVIDYGEQDGIAYLVMELTEGQTLANLGGTLLDATEVVSMLEPVAAALDYVNARGVVHGDIKPSNIMLTRNGLPVLADSGLLGLATNGKPMSELGDTGGLMIGTPAYMAPEIANGAQLAPATDRYAVAVIAYELLAGRVPYTGESPAAVLIAHVLQPLPSPRTLNPKLPGAVDEVFHKALAKDPAERYRWAADFVAALAAALRQDGVGNQPAHATVPPATTGTLEAAATITAAASAPVAAEVAAPDADAGPEAHGTTTALSPNLGAPRRGRSVFNPMLLAIAGGAVLVLLAGVVALTRYSGSHGTSSLVAATNVAAPASTAAVLVSATATMAPTEAKVVQTPMPTASLLSLPGTWRMGRAMHTARGVARAVTLRDGRILVMGGSGADGPLSDAELYDPSTGRWTVTGSMHIAREYFTATILLNGRVLVAGGTDSESYLADAEIYDPRVGTWTVTGSMRTPRDEHVAALLPNGTVLVAGGETTDTAPVRSTEIYDPRKGDWAPAPPMSTARWDATATLLANGTVLVAGGGSASAEVYDPASNRWKATGPMSTVRYRHTATLLPNHMVLVAGGEHAFTSLLDTAEIFDPRTNTWTSAGTMPHPHSRHTATLLPNGDVLVAGGSTGKDAQASLESGTSSVDIYDPASHRWSSVRSMRVLRAEQGAALLRGGRVLQIGGYTSQGAVTATTDIYGTSAER